MSSARASIRLTALVRLTAALTLAALAAPARAQCNTWTPGLASSAHDISPGPFGDAVVFDDGSGDAWYATGNLSQVGGQQGFVTRWRDGKWEVVYDSGIGFDKYVERIAGGVTGGVPHLFVTQLRLGNAMRGVLQWDGVNWIELGICNGQVRGLYVLDDGGGNALYVTGTFTQVNGIPITNVAKWNGASWSGFGAGPSFDTRALVFADTGTGLQLHAGAFSPGAGVTSVERFDGANWSPLGSITSAVGSFAQFDAGSGSELYAGTLQGLQRWNGSGWTLAGGTAQDSRTLAVADLGAGTRLFVFGAYTSIGAVPADSIASWDGSTFAPLGAGFNLVVGGLVIESLGVLTENGTPKLAAHGDFVVAGGRFAEGFAQWDGSNWTPLGNGFNGTLNALGTCDFGSGNELYAAGEFSRAGGALPSSPALTLQHVVRWDGAGWTAVGDFGPFVYALGSADAGGTGRKLYATGRFDDAPYRGIAAFDGATWTDLAGGLHGEGFALLEHDDGSGPRLFVGGSFATSQSSPANRVAAWNGTSWANVGGAMNDLAAALAIHDEGSGPKLFAAGRFTLSGPSIVTKRIARWDGTNWTSLGSGAANGIGDGGVNALASFGGELYAGGTFTLAGGAPVNYLARWNGTTWSDVPGGGANGAVLTLTVHDARGTSAETTFVVHVAQIDPGVPTVPTTHARARGCSVGDPREVASTGALACALVAVLLLVARRFG